MAQPAKPVWAGQDLRLDPLRLPQAVSYATDLADMTFTITKRGIVREQRRGEIDAAVASLMPLAQFKGVAARAMEDEHGNATVTLELHHDNADLCVPLLVAHDLEAVQADWHRWSALFNLPMLLIEGDGRAMTLEESLERYEAETPRAPRPERPGFGVFCRKGLGVRLVVGGMNVIEAANANERSA